MNKTIFYCDNCDVSGLNKKLCKNCDNKLEKYILSSFNFNDEE